MMSVGGNDDVSGRQWGRRFVIVVTLLYYGNDVGGYIYIAVALVIYSRDMHRWVIMVTSWIRTGFVSGLRW